MFSVAAFYERACVTAHGVAHGFTRASGSGFDVTFRFCPACGSSLWWEPARMPHLIGVAAGAFADLHFSRPEQAVWSRHRHCWLDLPPDMPAYDMNPGQAMPRD